MEFSLEGKSFIELNRVVKYIGWADSGGEANRLIDEGKIYVNGTQEFRRRNKLKAGDKVQWDKQECLILL